METRPAIDRSAGSPRSHEETPLQVVEIHLEAAGRRSWTSAMAAAVLGAGGGPVYRFVATAADTGDEGEPVAVGATFPLLPFQELEQQDDYEWTDLTRRRLHELRSELEAAGWTPCPERGRHWWSLRYQR